MVRPTKDWLWIASLVAMAVGLHIQPTLALAGGDVRFSLADLIGLLLVPLVGWLLVQNRDLWRRREIRIAIALIAAASLVMTMGLVKAGMSPHGISSWAWVKYVGWYVLLYYGVLGILAGMLAPQAAVTWFIRVFVIGHGVLILGYIVAQSIGINWPGSATPRMSGLMDNPNAYGLSSLCALALILGTGERVFAHMPKYGFEVVCGLLCAGVLFTRSLGALGGLVVVASVALAGQRDLVRLMRIAIIALALYALPSVGTSLARLVGFPVTQVEGSLGGKLSDPDKYAFSLSARLQSNARAVELWQEAPLLGAGLGVFYEREKAGSTLQRPALQVHNTPIWILTEFGLVGACALGAFFGTIAFFLLRAWLQSRGADPPLAGFSLAGLMTLGAWATMSLAHELLYQRLPWLTVAVCLGMALRESLLDLRCGTDSL